MSELEQKQQELIQECVDLRLELKTERKAREDTQQQLAQQIDDLSKCKRKIEKMAQKHKAAKTARTSSDTDLIRRLDALEQQQHAVVMNRAQHSEQENINTTHRTAAHASCYCEVDPRQTVCAHQQFQHGTPTKPMSVPQQYQYGTPSPVQQARPLQLTSPQGGVFPAQQLYYAY